VAQITLDLELGVESEGDGVPVLQPAVDFGNLEIVLVITNFRSVEQAPAQ